ncbi:hypothetical protein D3C74_404100 [compost metagenome]
MQLLCTAAFSVIRDFNDHNIGLFFRLDCRDPEIECLCFQTYTVKHGIFYKGLNNQGRYRGAANLFIHGNLKIKRLLVTHFLNFEIIAEMFQFLFQSNAVILYLKHKAEILHQMAYCLFYQFITFQVGKLKNDIERVQKKMRINLHLQMLQFCLLCV